MSTTDTIPVSSTGAVSHPAVGPSVLPGRGGVPAGPRSLRRGDQPPQVHRVLAAVHNAPAQSRPILQIAARIAESVSAPLTAMSVVETAPICPPREGSTRVMVGVSSPPSPTVLEGIGEYLRNLIGRAAPEYAPGGARQGSADAEVLTGDPEYEIGSRAAALHAAILVIGRGDVRGRGKVLGTLLSGTRAARVCRSSQVPVVAVAAPASDGADPLATTVVATDFSPASWEAAVAAARSVPPAGRVYVVHALRQDQAAEPGRCEAARARLTAWAAPLAALLPSKATISVTVLAGDPYGALAQYLSAVGATCVAVGGHRWRPNAVTVPTRTIPERLLATWRGSIILGPSRELA